MAFSKASQLAKFLKARLLDEVAVSVGQSKGLLPEVVIKGFDHPDDGMSRRWHIDINSESGLGLDMIIKTLRKAGFNLTGSAPQMKGTISQALDRREQQQLKEVQIKNEIKGEQSELKNTMLRMDRATSQRFEDLAMELQKLREFVEDLQLIPIKGPKGDPGEPGKDGKDGTAGYDGKDFTLEALQDAGLSNLKDVSQKRPSDGDVLMWRNGKWTALQIASAQPANFGSGGEGGGAPGGMPQDNHFYVGRNGEWVPLVTAWQTLIDGGNFETGFSYSMDFYMLDGGDFMTGDALPNYPQSTADAQLNGGFAVV